jgi:amidase
VPFLMKDLGPTMKGRLQEMGSLFMRGNRPGEPTASSPAACARPA